MTKPKSTAKTKKDSRKACCLSNPPIGKQHRKGKSPRRVMPTFGNSNSRICKNSTCGAIRSINDMFCRRCSCYICHGFNDTNDPSLWLVCKSSSSQRDSCELACNIECALQHERVGVVNHGQIIQLDGSYCCACGKVTEILGCWKKQLSITKDARQVDVLQYRINLSSKLLDGTSRFKELDEIVKKAKSILEATINIENEMRQGKITRLAIASEAQKLCSLAVEKADEWLATISNVDIVTKDVSSLVTFSCVFEEITHSSITIIVVEMSNASSERIEDYKLLYYKSLEKSHKNGPFLFSRAHRRIVISKLQPCTEYTFCITSLTSISDQACCEVKCFTKSVDIFQKRHHSLSVVNYEKKDQETKASSYGSKINPYALIRDSSLEAQFHGTVLPHASAQEQGPIKEFYDANIEIFQGGSEITEVETHFENYFPVFYCSLDLNASIPILNEDVTHTHKSSEDDDNDYALQLIAKVDGVEKISLVSSHDVGASKSLSSDPTKEKSIVYSCADVCGKMVANTDEIFQKRHNSLFALNYEKKDQEIERSSYNSKINLDPLTRNFSQKAQNFETLFPLASAQEQGPIKEFHDANIENFQKGSKMIKVETPKENHLPILSYGLDLNDSMPILNEDVTDTHEPFKDDDNNCTLQSAAQVNGMEKISLARSHVVGGSKTSFNKLAKENMIVESCANVHAKRAISTNEICDNNIQSKNKSFLLISNDSYSLKENLRYYLGIFRWLEQEGHMTEDFRLKLLRWFCLRSTEQERVVVNTYIQTLISDPSILVRQLVDSFSEIIARKSPRY